MEGTIYSSNNFTCKDASVVDYCLIPHEDLHLFSKFDVLDSKELFNKYCLGILDPLHAIPDHSMIRWNLTIELPPTEIKSISQEIKYKMKYDVSSIPDGADIVSANFTYQEISAPTDAQINNLTAFRPSELAPSNPEEIAKKMEVLEDEAELLKQEQEP